MGDDKLTSAELDDAAAAIEGLDDDTARTALAKEYTATQIDAILARRDKLARRPPRPLDDAFWEAWLACEDECLGFAIKLARSKQRGQDLFESAFKAIVDGVRPWREGTALASHAKGCIKSIFFHESTSMSGLELNKSDEDEDPDVEDEERDPEQRAIDGEEADILRRCGRDLLAEARPDTLEQRVLQQLANGVTDRVTIATNLGVLPRQVTDVKKTIRRKAQKWCREHGYDLLDDQDDEDGS